MAYGRLSMSSREFYESTPREFNNRLRGFDQLEAERRRGEWERARFITFYLGQFDRKKVSKLTDLIRFDWDEDTAPPDPRKNPDIQKMFELWDKDINKE